MNNFMQLKIRQFIEKKIFISNDNWKFNNWYIYINSTNQRAKIFELSENNL